MERVIGIEPQKCEGKENTTATEKNVLNKKVDYLRRTFVVSLVVQCLKLSG